MVSFEEPGDLVEVAWDLLTSSFYETLWFLIGLVVVLCGSCIVGLLLVKLVDRDQEPFLAFRLPGIEALPLLATLFTIFCAIVQIITTVFQFWSGEGEVLLANIALRNTFATLGMEAAFLVVLGCTTVISLFFHGISEEEAEQRQRSRSGKRD